MLHAHQNLNDVSLKNNNKRLHKTDSPYTVLEPGITRSRGIFKHFYKKCLIFPMFDHILWPYTELDSFLNISPNSTGARGGKCISSHFH